MQPDLVITTQADFDLYEHLNAACYTLYRKKRSYLATIIAAVVLGGYLVASALLSNDMFFLFVITPIWIIAFLSISYYLTKPSTVSRRAAKRAMKVSGNAPIRIKYSFYPDHIAIVGPTSEVATGYQGITGLVETSKFYLIFTNPVNAHCIRKSDLGPSNVAVFREYIQDKTGRRFTGIRY